MLNKVVSQFIKIVQIDSPSGEEALIRKYLDTRLKKIGFVTRIDKTGNLFATTGQSSASRLLVCAHMDTVNPGKAIKPIITKGTIKSDGTTILGADNKAAISAIMIAIEEYFKNFNKLPPIEILFSVNEETGGGVEFFNFKWIKSKKGLTFDYANPLGVMCLAAPYIYNFRIKFKGKSAHASRPEKGVNALNIANKFLSLFKVGSFDNHKTTINVGKISGGSGINIIPEEVYLEGEVRSTDKNKFDKHLKQVKILMNKVIKGTRVNAELKFDGYCPGYSYKKGDKYVTEIASILKEEGLKVGYESSTGVSDVNSLMGAGITSICISDGVKDPHSTKESISIKDLEKLKDLIYAFVISLAHEKRGLENGRMVQM